VVLESIADISGYMCGARRVVRGLCCSQHPPPMGVPMNDPDTCTSYQRSRWTRCWIIQGPMLVCSSTPAYSRARTRVTWMYRSKVPLPCQNPRWECDRPGVEPTSSGPHDWGQYHSSEKVSCDEWYWNPSLIYRDICVERGASYAACAAHNRKRCIIYI